MRSEQGPRAASRTSRSDDSRVSPDDRHSPPLQVYRRTRAARSLEGYDDRSMVTSKESCAVCIDASRCRCSRRLSSTRYTTCAKKSRNLFLQVTCCIDNEAVGRRGIMYNGQRQGEITSTEQPDADDGGGVFLVQNMSPGGSMISGEFLRSCKGSTTVRA
nr:hypothetical protein CFP56_77514 [Quercus suber]